MKKYKLSDMTKGWFVGDFSPTVFRTKHCEVGVKHYEAGTKEQLHYHKKAEELTAVISGKVKMNDSIFIEGDISENDLIIISRIPDNLNNKKVNIEIN